MQGEGIKVDLEWTELGLRERGNCVDRRRENKGSLEISLTRL